MQTLNRARSAPPPPHSTLPLGVQMALRRAAALRDIDAIDAITDDLARLGRHRPRWDNVLPSAGELACQAARALAGGRGL
jgi:hypothetical protein